MSESSKVYITLKYPLLLLLEPWIITVYFPLSGLRFMSQQVSVWTLRQDGSTQAGAMRSSKGLFVKTTDLMPQWTASWNSDVYQHLYHTEHALTAWCIGISVRACMNVYGSRWFSDGRPCLCERLCELMIIVNAHK